MNDSYVSDESESEQCMLCERTGEPLTKHHLIPRSRHNKRRTQKEFEKEEMVNRVAWVCRPCHSNIHICYSNKELVDQYDTLEKLAAAPDIMKFTKWIAKRPPGTKIPFRRG